MPTIDDVDCLSPRVDHADYEISGPNKARILRPDLSHKLWQRRS